MRLFLEGKNGNKDMVLENVKEWNESVHDRKIYVSYNDDRENESYSMIQYMAVPEDFNNKQRTTNILNYMSGEKKNRHGIIVLFMKLFVSCQYRRRYYVSWRLEELYI